MRWIVLVGGEVKFKPFTFGRLLACQSFLMLLTRICTRQHACDWVMGRGGRFMCLFETERWIHERASKTLYCSEHLCWLYELLALVKWYDGLTAGWDKSSETNQTFPHHFVVTYLPTKHPLSLDAVSSPQCSGVTPLSWCILLIPHFMALTNVTCPHTEEVLCLLSPPLLYLSCVSLFSLGNDFTSLSPCLHVT